MDHFVMNDPVKRVLDGLISMISRCRGICQFQNNGLRVREKTMPLGCVNV